jgi:hypothetical protein
MEVAHSSKTMIDFQHTVPCYVPEYRTLQFKSDFNVVKIHVILKSNEGMPCIIIIKKKHSF